ncbi:glycosyltransferase [Hymenobacter sp. IS2118]|uniref:glycosyltransferase n=1 Tax=Hymenobacter sp. IS2118 TaxID=1505605 RepID=UPI0005545197|nr:glycosyltransferase [Hymenobacter sp. IS2118]
MTAPTFSVLLLAWDDADPSVAVLGGSALPPTLPLVYQLATQQPVLALYPTLPATETATETPPEPAAAGDDAPGEAAVLNILTTTEHAPGLRQLPGQAPTTPATEPIFGSRIIGLSDLTANSAAALPAAITAVPETAQSQALARAHNQWPTGRSARKPTRWEAPAAPYLGAGPGAASLLPTPLSADTLPASEAAGALPDAELVPASNAPVSDTALRPRTTPQAGDLSFDPDPELPAVLHPATFSEESEEPGTGEAADLLAPEDDITLDLPAHPAPSPAPPATALGEVAAPASAPTPLLPAFNGLNFRIIQYARQAAQLVRGGAEFGVIYAPNWPAWLAALEIRNSSGQPLVLYLASLATDIAGPAERGWLLEMERMTLRRARVILVPDADLRQRLNAQYGDAIGEVRVVAAADEAAVQRVLREVALTI